MDQWIWVIHQKYDYRHLGKKPFHGHIADEMRKHIDQYLPLLLRDLVGHDLEADHCLA
jgi:hypothetical protein